MAGEGTYGAVREVQDAWRMCMSCGRDIARDALSCPHCHWTVGGRPGHVAYSEPISTGKRALLYACSLLIPLFGIVLGAVYLSWDDEEHRHVGTRCLILGVVSLVLLPTLLSVILYVTVLSL